MDMTNKPLENVNALALTKKAQIVGILERVCQELELTDTQLKTASERYYAVANFLSSAEQYSDLQQSYLYPQGSISLGTTVRPIRYNEFDIDLVCHLPTISLQTPATRVKRLVGDRLRCNETYRKILEEKPRCWRLNYANEFHMDITPSIPDASCANGGELVPDKQQVAWKGSNPRGYKARFEEYAAIQPMFYSHLYKTQFAEARAAIEALPEPSAFKSILKRLVQLLKRHRDLHFQRGDANLAPISIIITTLAAQSYAFCARNRVYTTEFDLLVDVVRVMPHFIEITEQSSVRHYRIPNETTPNENFAEKWNVDGRLPYSFYVWHTEALRLLEEVAVVQGIDRLHKELSASFGESVVTAATSHFAKAIDVARVAGNLAVAPAVGLVSSVSRATPVRPNTFFGL